jgi:hypothetical protein
MKPQESTLNKPGSKYSPGPVLYNLALFKMGATGAHIRAGKGMGRELWFFCLFLKIWQE